MNDLMWNKLQALSAQPDQYFMFGAVDHSPQELVKENTMHISAFIFYNVDFHKKLSALGIQLKKWSRSRGNDSYRKKFIEEYWPEMQELPFFAHVASISGDKILQSKQRYLKELGLSRVVEESGGYHKYTVCDKDGRSRSFSMKERMSLSALHIANFIIRAFFGFKDFCKQYNIPMLDDPFQVYHDRLPGDNPMMGGVISKLVSLSLYMGYSVRIMSLMHWGARDEKHIEGPDELLVDNLAGLFKDIAAGKHKGNEILAVNQSILDIESVT